MRQLAGGGASWLVPVSALNAVTRSSTLRVDTPGRLDFITTADKACPSRAARKGIAARHAASQCLLMAPATTRVRRSVRAPRSYTVAVPGYRCRHGHTALDDEHQSSRRISTFARTTSTLCGTAPVATAGHPVPHRTEAE